jgi:hypothetical protein
MENSTQNLGIAFLEHAKRANCVWERTRTGKWRSREVTPQDTKRWKEIGMRYLENGAPPKEDTTED